MMARHSTSCSHMETTTHQVNTGKCERSVVVSFFLYHTRPRFIVMGITLSDWNMFSAWRETVFMLGGSRAL